MVTTVNSTVPLPKRLSLESVVYAKCADTYTGVNCKDGYSFVSALRERTFDFMFMIGGDVYLHYANLRQSLVNMSTTGDFSYGIVGCADKDARCPLPNGETRKGIIGICG